MYEWCNNKTSHTSFNLLHFGEEKNTSNKDIFLAAWQNDRISVRYRESGTHMLTPLTQHLVICGKLVLPLS